MILAGSDIGTNTLRLLVAEIGADSFHEIYADRRITRLGQDIDRTGVLSRDAEERTLDALLDFTEQIRRHAARHSAAIGTSALRNALNSLAFINEVKKRTGLDISFRIQRCVFVTSWFRSSDRCRKPAYLSWMMKRETGIE